MDTKLIFQLFIATFISVCYAVTPTENRSSKRIKRDLKEAHIVPQIIKKAPFGAVQIIYPGIEAHFGNTIGRNYSHDPPKLIWPASEDSFYTVAMVDPDDEKVPEESPYQWLHWLVVNVRGMDVSSGDTIAEYIAPDPQEILKLYRYVVLVFLQPVDRPMNFTINEETDDLRDYRTRWSTQKFVDIFHLEPIAANFFRSELKVEDWKSPGEMNQTTTQKPTK